MEMPRFRRANGWQTVWTADETRGSWGGRGLLRKLCGGLETVLSFQTENGRMRHYEQQAPNDPEFLRSLFGPGSKGPRGGTWHSRGA